MSGQTRRPILIGIGGGSGSGKTFLARQIQAAEPDHVSLLSMDQYFHSEAAADGANVNFDHPAHLDLDLMLRHIQDLRGGRAIDAPAYDFRKMHQTPKARHIEPTAIVLIDGLFVLAEPFASLIDLTLFLDVADDQRLLGRILRDLDERDATIARIVDRYQRFVRPSYNVFVAPTRHNADLVVDFTYRRALLAELLVHVVRDYVRGFINMDALLERMRGSELQLGCKPGDSIMPIAIDIRRLAEAFPESAPPGSRGPVEEPLLRVANAQ